MSESANTAVARTSAPLPVQEHLDPFQLMDRMDDEAIRLELEGIISEDLVYVVKDERGKELVGLSKVGVDESCMVLAKKGEVVRELDLQHEIATVDGELVALFKGTAARFAVSADGREVKLDQVIGTKVQPLFYEAATPLSLDSSCPGKKEYAKGGPVKPDGSKASYREMLATDDTRGYLAWMRDKDGDWPDEQTRDFLARILNGEDVQVQPGRQRNPFWYEQGSQKALRNARFRLVPASIRAQVIAMAREAGRVREASTARKAAAATAAGKSGNGTPPSAPKAAPAAALTLDTPIPFGKYGPKDGKPGRTVREAGIHYFQAVLDKSDPNDQEKDWYKFTVKVIALLDEEAGRMGDDEAPVPVATHPALAEADAVDAEIFALTKDESIPPTTRQTWGQMWVTLGGKITVDDRNRILTNLRAAKAKAAKAAAER